MRRIFIFFLFMLTTAIAPDTYAANSQEMITLRLPQQIISDAVTALLPYKIDTNSKNISGDITIISISEIELTKDLLTCRLNLAGNDLALSTELAGHKIKLNVGSTEIDFKTDAAIRFDTKQQILYVKPQVRELKSGNNGKADIGQALVALFHGQEFPIQMQKLEPLVAKTGTKEIIINSQIAKIKAIPQAIKIGLIPIITAKE